MLLPKTTERGYNEVRMEREAMKLYLAADSGGSKTVWNLINIEGKTVFSCRTEGLGAVKEGILPVEETVSSAVEQLRPIGMPVAIHLSLGGPNTAEVRSALEKAWPGVPTVVEREACGDSILWGATFLGCSAVVMCGTGSTAVGNKKSGRAYCGGWGPVYGDGGSGGGLGSEALRMFLRSLDGLAEMGQVADLFAPLTEGLDFRDFYDRMEVKRRALDMSRRELAALAPAIYKLYEQGDKTACRLYEASAKEVADMAEAVSDPDAMVLLCGGFFAEKPKFLEACQNYSQRNLFYEPDFAPIVGVKLSLLKENGVAVTKELFEQILDENRR